MIKNINIDQAKESLSQSGLIKNSQNLKKISDDKKLKEACKDFEAILIHQMLKSMRSTIQKEGLLSGGFEEEIYQSMYDEELSNFIAHSNKSMGLGDSLYAKLSKRSYKNESIK